MKDKIEEVFMGVLRRSIASTIGASAGNVLIAFAIFYVGVALFDMSNNIYKGFIFLGNNLYRIR